MLCDLGQVSAPLWSQFPKLLTFAHFFQFELFLSQTDSVQAVHVSRGRTQSKVNLEDESREGGTNRF